MDPLSIATATITIASLATCALKALKDACKAEDEFGKLIVLVSTLWHTLDQVKEALNHRRDVAPLSESTSELIASTLCAVQDKFQALQILLDRMTASIDANGNPKVKRVQWVKHKSDAAALCQDLSTYQTGLHSMCQAISMFDTSRMMRQLEKIMLLSQDGIAYHCEELAQIQRLGNAMWMQDSVSDNGDKPREDAIRITEIQVDSTDDGETIIIPRHVPEIYYEDNDVARYDRNIARARAYRKAYCDGWCSCACHESVTFQTPRSLQFILGAMMFSFAGIPSLVKKCTESTCQQQSIPVLKMLYHFPSWMWPRAVRAAISFTDANGMSFGLTMPRIIPGDSLLFSYVVQGDLGGVVDLFNKGAASPFDVAGSNGRNALHYAVTYNHLELTKYLIDKGAKPELEDKDNNSTIKLAWSRIFGNLAETSTLNSWRCLFDDEEHLESRCFPRLHKIVLSLNGADLRQALEQSTASINERDQEGKTALSWAATRSDIAAVRTLLDFKADPNIVSKRGTSPLQFAAQSHHAGVRQVFEALLQNGAAVDNVDSYSRTALTYGACNQPDPDTLRPLAEAGANLEQPDCWQRTPLGYAAKSGHADGVAYLLRLGANVNAADNSGKTPLYEAISGNFQKVIETIWQEAQSSLDLTLVDRHGWTAFHVAASHGNAQTMRLLAPYVGCGGLDVHLRAYDGQTAADCFGERDDVDTELGEAWRALTDLSRDIDSEDDGDDDGFFDAAEIIESLSLELPVKSNVEPLWHGNGVLCSEKVPGVRVTETLISSVN